MDDRNGSDEKSEKKKLRKPPTNRQHLLDGTRREGKEGSQGREGREGNHLHCVILRKFSGLYSRLFLRSSPNMINKELQT